MVTIVMVVMMVAITMTIIAVVIKRVWWLYGAEER